MKDGGPAFPQSLAVSPEGDVYHSGEVFHGSGGMSLWDWFAGRALNGVLSGLPHMAWKPAEAADLSAKLADAMLAARDNGGE